MWSPVLLGSYFSLNKRLKKIFRSQKFVSLTSTHGVTSKFGLPFFSDGLLLLLDILDFRIKKEWKNSILVTIMVLLHSFNPFLVCLQFTFRFIFFVWDRTSSRYVKWSEKLTFLTLWYAQVQDIQILLSLTWILFNNFTFLHLLFLFKNCFPFLEI